LARDNSGVERRKKDEENRRGKNRKNNQRAIVKIECLAAIMTNFFNSIPSPLILCRDFNGHSLIWGSKDLNNRGNVIEYLLNELNISILNNHKQPTYFNVANGTFSTIDMSSCSTSLTFSIIWNIHPDLNDSNHALNTISKS